jgi:hypothetical protein
MKYRSEQPSEGTTRPSQMSFFNRQTNAQAVIQPKLTVGSAHDAHEHEANRTADMVMRKPSNSAENGAYTEGSSFMPTITPVIQRACAACEHDKEQTAQRKETGAATGGFTAPPSVSRAISRSGNALDSNAKTFMESRFNRSFDNVQVHTDSDAASSARDISARAYTSGNHIVFGEGQYQPNCEGGRHLLAHELTHVVQQGGSSVSKSIQRDSSQCLADAERQLTRCTDAAGTYCTRIQIMSGVAAGAIGAGLGSFGGPLGTGVGGLLGAGLGSWLTSDCGEKANRRCRSQYEATKANCS